ncbi:MAG: hypothetical protein ACO1RX_06950 [Candidatus Sericytochromatia bacterium]
MTYLNTTVNPALGYQVTPSQATTAPLQTVAPVSLPTAAADSYTSSFQPAALVAPSAVQFAPNASYSPTVPTLTSLSISRDALNWATQMEARVQQGYQPTAEERAYYDALGTQLTMMRQNVQPMSATPALPQIQNWNAPQATAPQQGPAANPNVFGPGMPAADQQVTMSEIEWALMLEEKVQKYGYTPTPEEEAKYQNTLARFKTNSEIKMEFLDSLAAQSPWVGANVASMRYSKIAATQVSNVISAIKNGTGSVAGALKSLGMTAVKSTGLSALVSGAFSAVTNGIAYYQGKKTKTQAVANVVTDTVTGAATGLGATVVGGAAMAALAGTSIAGWGLTLLVGGAGILGGFLADKLLTKSGAKDWVKSKVISMMDGLGSPKPAQTAQPQQAAAAAIPQAGYPTYAMPSAN